MAHTHDETSAKARPEVVLYTRVGCSLCEQAEAALIELCEPLGFVLDARDVDQDATLLKRYGDRVPVVTYGDRELAEGAIDARGLRDVLGAALGLGLLLGVARFPFHPQDVSPSRHTGL